ncbi:hypothetical protein DFI02_1011291 [Rhizobium sp. PP-F2F-G20b]|nr:hypothetical protein DFI02_1011291 [Rhizobium sp. PP-F2F-G20b]
MAVRPTRYQTRRTPTAGKVFAPSELYEGELGLNMPDRKLYAKDDHGVVFQIGGEPGRAPGKMVQFENYFDVPTIFTDKYIMFRQANPTKNDFANVAFYRDTGTNDTFGAEGGDVVVNQNVVVRTDVRAKTNSFQWNFLAQVEVHPGLTHSDTNKNEPIVLGGTLRKHSDMPAWVLYTSSEDYTVNPMYATLGWELGFKVNGPDPNKRRVVIDMQLNSIDDVPGYTKYGDNELACALNMTPSVNESDRVVVEKMIRMTGRIGVGIDMSGMKKAVKYGTNTQYYADHDLECIALPTGGNIVFRNGENGPIVGGLSYNQAIGNGGFALSGVTIGTGHTNNGESLLIMVNGVQRWIPLQN